MKLWTSLTLGLLTLGPTLQAQGLTAAADRALYGYWLRNPRMIDQPQGFRYAITTDQYALVLNLGQGGIERIGSTPDEWMARLFEPDSTWLERLPASGLNPWIELDGRRYRVEGSTPGSAAKSKGLYESLQLVDGGRYLQHIELHNLLLKDAEGQAPAGVKAWLQLACWPDFIALSLHVAPVGDAPSDRKLRVGLDAPAGLRDLALRPADLESDVSNTSVSLHMARDFDAFTTASAGWLIVPRRKDPETYAERVMALGVPQSHKLKANPSGTQATTLETWFDRRLWARRVELDPVDSHWKTEQIDFTVDNASDETLLLPLIFSKIDNVKEESILMGFGSLLTDTEHGEPLGIPMQISKNWHVKPAWSRVMTLLPLDARQTLSLRYVRPYALWAGVPAVSHSQLCLVGWGGNQLWDQVALGSFGENICYDPNVNLQRAVIDDIRPMQVWGFDGPEAGKEQWTVNVGGAEFFALQPADRDAPSLKVHPMLLPDAAKADYAKIGPVISEVTYTGEYADGAVQSRVTTYAWRSDDFFRAVFHIRYDVRQAVDFGRLALFQLGADRYNDNLFRTIARGDADGVHESWEPPMGDQGYSRRAQPLSGQQPWIALLGAVADNEEHARAAWPNRALIVRGWQARLGGREIAEPHYSVRGTDNRMASAQFEISAPEDINRLEPEDFVEMWLELDVLPQAAGDYFGPNQAMRERLEQLPPAQLVQSIARDGLMQLDVSHGTRERSHLPIIRAEVDPAAQTAAEFTLRGGWGFAPLMISGLPRPDGWILEAQEDDAWRQVDPTPAGEFQRQTDWTGEANGYTLSYTLARPTTDTLRLRLRQQDAE